MTKPSKSFTGIHDFLLPSPAAVKFSSNRSDESNDILDQLIINRCTGIAILRDDYFRVKYPAGGVNNLCPKA